MTIKIPVSADFDGASVERQIQQFQQKLNQLGTQIAQANKVQFNPISKATLDDLRKVTAQFEALRRVSGDLNKRINATGQKGLGFTDLDWNKLYPDQASRSRQMAKAFQYVTGLQFGAANAGGGGGGGTRPPGGNPPPPSGGGGHNWGSMGVNAVQAGLRATGPAGGVAANSMSTGLNAGFGAGMMGLLGGMLALGVSKLVGAATEKIDQAENNAVAYDRLKRTLGDVNVSFSALKTAVNAAADNTKITYAESARLTTEFAKLGNVTSEQYKTVSREVETGVGLSRSFGLDPDAGVGVLGRMRGMRMTGSEQETRRFALLIGETIGKSNAFAKADEVMEAIASFATSQTRSNMGRANVGGYAGMFSAMTGSGIPGLDPAGTSALLARVNASLSAGGAKGEASQFFTGMVGHRMGLDPIQTQMMREGGAFSTNDSTFGKGSIWSRFMGKTGPTGSMTHLEGQLMALRQTYSNKGQLAQATANHLGVSMGQAMALHLVQPNQMGEMQKYADLTKLSGSGIGNLSKALYGTDADRKAIAGNLRGRTGDDKLSSSELARLDQVMKSGDVGAQKQVLAELVATRDQERTMGTDIRDSKNALDNIKVAIADKLVPLTQEMRHGIMYLAGNGKKSPETVMREVLQLESSDRVKSIEGEFKNKIDAQDKRIVDARMSERLGDPEKARESARIQQEANAEIARLEKEKKKLIEEEKRLLDKRVADMRKEMADRRLAEETARAAEAQRQQVLNGGAGPRPNIRRGRSSGGGSGGAALDQATAASLSDVADPSQRANLKSFLDTLGASEGAGYNTIVGGGRFSDFSSHPNYVGLVTGDGPSTAAGRYQITNTTWRRVAKQLGLKDFSPESQDRAAIELLRQRGALNDVLAGNWQAAVGKLGNEWQSLPSGTSAHQGKRSWKFFNAIMQQAQQRNRGGMPMPDEAAAEMKREANRAAGMAFRVSADPIRVVHENNKGQQVAPSQTLPTRVSAPQPFGK